MNKMKTHIAVALLTLMVLSVSGVQAEEETEAPSEDQCSGDDGPLDPECFDPWDLITPPTCMSVGPGVYLWNHEACYTDKGPCEGDKIYVFTDGACSNQECSGGNQVFVFSDENCGMGCDSGNGFLIFTPGSDGNCSPDHILRMLRLT